jgi:hypothetical protein
MKTRIPIAQTKNKNIIIALTREIPRGGSDRYCSPSLQSHNFAPSF